MNYLIPLVVGLAICFGVQALALKVVGGRTVKSESNYFSSIGRIQAGAKGNPEIMLLGSSITGRLPDRAQGFEGVANLGCDGGSAVDTIRAIDQGRLPIAPVIVVEANALHVGLRGPSEIAGAMEGLWFQAGRHFQLVSAYARPAAFLYSPLLARRTGGFGELPQEGFGLSSAPGPPPADWAKLCASHQEEVLADELAKRCRRLADRGSRVVVVWLPPARAGDTQPPTWIRRMVGRGGVEWWDLAAHVEPSQVGLTDFVHMDAKSATRTLLSLLEGLGDDQGEG